MHVKLEELQAADLDIESHIFREQLFGYSNGFLTDISETSSEEDLHQSHVASALMLENSFELDNHEFKSPAPCSSRSSSTNSREFEILNLEQEHSPISSDSTTDDDDLKMGVCSPLDVIMSPSNLEEEASCDSFINEIENNFWNFDHLFDNKQSLENGNAVTPENQKQREIDKFNSENINISSPLVASHQITTSFYPHQTSTPFDPHQNSILIDSQQNSTPLDSQQNFTLFDPQQNSTPFDSQQNSISFNQQNSTSFDLQQNSTPRERYQNLIANLNQGQSNSSDSRLKFQNNCSSSKKNSPSRIEIKLKRVSPKDLKEKTSNSRYNFINNNTGTPLQSNQDLLSSLLADVLDDKSTVQTLPSSGSIATKSPQNFNAKVSTFSNSINSTTKQNCSPPIKQNWNLSTTLPNCNISTSTSNHIQPKTQHTVVHSPTNTFLSSTAFCNQAVNSNNTSNNTSTNLGRVSKKLSPIAPKIPPNIICVTSIQQENKDNKSFKELTPIAAKTTQNCDENFETVKCDNPNEIIVTIGQPVDMQSFKKEFQEDGVRIKKSIVPLEIIRQRHFEKLRKNRESAEKSRKKKKERLIYLEERVEELKSENKRLKIVNHALLKRLISATNGFKTTAPEPKLSRKAPLKRMSALMMGLFCFMLFNVATIREPMSELIPNSGGNFDQNSFGKIGQEKNPVRIFRKRSLLSVPDYDDDLNRGFMDMAPTNNSKEYKCPFGLNTSTSIRINNDLQRYFDGLSDVDKILMPGGFRKNLNGVRSPEPTRRKRRKNLNAKTQLKPLKKKLSYDPSIRKNDTYYYISLTPDLLLPASVRNVSSRPKISLLVALDKNVSPYDQLQFLQIDCEVSETRFVEWDRQLNRFSARSDGFDSHFEVRSEDITRYKAKPESLLSQLSGFSGNRNSPSHKKGRKSVSAQNKSFNVTQPKYSLDNFTQFSAEKDSFNRTVLRKTKSGNRTSKPVNRTTNKTKDLNRNKTDEKWLYNDTKFGTNLTRF